jgi:hypothetical protein
LGTSLRGSVLRMLQLKKIHLYLTTELKLSTVFVWIFVVGNLLVGALHYLIKRFFYIYPYQAPLLLPRGVPSTFSFLYAVFSLVLLYVRRRDARSLSPRTVNILIGLYLCLTIVWLFLLGAFSPIQVLGVVISHIVIGDPVSLALAPLNPCFYASNICH